MDPFTPTEIGQEGRDTLRIRWEDQHVSRFPVVYLRRACRCAVCVDEWSGAQILKPEQVAESVRPLSIHPVGRYAINIEWSDGHKSGIYTFEHLRQICPCPVCEESRAGSG